VFFKSLEKNLLAIYKMTLYNAASRARNVGRLVNQNSGGGSKKAGLFPTVGNDSWTSLAYGKVPGKCYTLACTRVSRYPNANCRVIRPIGSTVMTGWKC
jgi:hypothetical protein